MTNSAGSSTASTLPTTCGRGRTRTPISTSTTTGRASVREGEVLNMTSGERSIRLIPSAGDALDPGDIAYVDTMALRSTDDGLAELTLRVRAQRRARGEPWPRHDDTFMAFELRLRGVSD